jgi:Thermostable hemolysin
MRVTLMPRGDVLRPAAELLIANVYARRYGARISAFPNTLITLVGVDGGVHCAAGLRFAADGFFSEAYLDAPADALLSALRRTPVNRDKIFEVTSLASQSPRFVGNFLRKIIAGGESAGFEWAFFTATAPLRTLLERMGVALTPLAHADSTRLPNSGMWGSYYAFAPRVCAVHRDAVEACLSRQAQVAANG